jgi:hypothetical protein
MGGLEAKLTWRQEKAITTLLTHATVPAAAKACGIGKATLWRWLQQPAFQERYQAARRQLMEDAVSLLQKASLFDEMRV